MQPNFVPAELRKITIRYTYKKYNFGTHIPFSAEKHPIWAWVLFWKNSPIAQIQPILQIGRIGSVTETHPSICQISWKYTPKGSTYYYTEYPPPPKGGRCGRYCLILALYLVIKAHLSSSKFLRNLFQGKRKYVIWNAYMYCVVFVCLFCCCWSFVFCVFFWGVCLFVCLLLLLLLLFFRAAESHTCRFQIKRTCRRNNTVTYESISVLYIITRLRGSHATVPDERRPSIDVHGLVRRVKCRRCRHRWRLRCRRIRRASVGRASQWIWTRVTWLVTSGLNL